MKWAGRMCSEILNKIKESTNFPYVWHKFEVVLFLVSN